MTIEETYQQHIAVLEATLKLASYPGHYISTACQRGLHEHCRLSDKWDGNICQCECGHNPSTPLPPTYSELVAALKLASDTLRRILAAAEKQGG